MTDADLTPIPREVRPYQGVPAGLVTRLVANTIDAVVVGVMLVGCYLGLVGVLFFLTPRSFKLPDPSFLGSMVVILVLLIVYLTFAWWGAGRTYGDHVMGLRVVGGRGQRLGFIRSALRAVFCAFFPIGLLWCAWSPWRRSVQDAVLRTQVIYDWRHGGGEPRVLPDPPVLRPETSEVVGHTEDRAAPADHGPGPAD